MGNTMKQRNRKRKILFIGSAILILLVVVILILTPVLVKNYINKNGVELTGRTLLVEKLKYNYFTSTLIVYDAKMFEQNSSETFVSFDTLLVNLKPVSLLKHELHVQQFQVVNLNARILQNDTVFNFSDLIDFFYTGEKVEPDTTSEAYKLNLNQIEIQNGEVSYTDQQLDHTIGLQKISFIIPQIYWGGEKSTADVTFNIGAGGSISSSFDFDSGTGAYQGEAILHQLDPEIILPYLQEYINIKEIDGTFDADIRYSGNRKSLEDFLINGTAALKNLMLKDAQDRDVLGVADAEVELKYFKPLLYEAEIGYVRFNQPYAYVALIDSMTNIEKMLIFESAETQPSEEKQPYNIFIDQIRIERGLIDFSDQRLTETFNYELSDVKVDMDSLSLNTSWIKINSSMKLNKRGNLEAQLGINPYNPFQHIELNYVLSDFQLPDVNIYSKHYTGLPILFGEMYYVNKTTIIDRQLESSNELVIRNVEMGRKTGGLYDVPIKLALFILKDINGDVVLDIPVSGDLSDPKTNVGQIVWNTFKGFMFKIVASPFKVLGSLLGADPKELEEITFIYSDSTLTGKQRRSLDLLLELEQMKPELAIQMQYLNDRKLERADAAAQIVQKAYQKANNKNPLTQRKDYLEYLQKESGRDSLVMQDYERLLAPPGQVDSLIELREINRIEMVSDYIQAQNDSSSIIIREYQPQEVLNIGSRPRFSISYKLAEDLSQKDSIP